MTASIRLTPEETARLRSRIELDISPNCPYRLYGLGTGHIARQQHVEIGKVRLAETVVEFEDSGGRRLRALDLLVRSMVAYWFQQRFGPRLGRPACLL